VVSRGWLHFWRAGVPELGHVHGENAVGGGDGGSEPHELVGSDPVNDNADEKRDEEIDDSPGPFAEISESGAGEEEIEKEGEPGFFHRASIEIAATRMISRSQIRVIARERSGRSADQPYVLF